MQKTIFFLLITILAACSSSTPKIPVHAWLGSQNNATKTELQKQFTGLKAKGVDAIMYSGGHDYADYARIGKIAHRAGLKFHAWIPTLLQGFSEKVDSSWYVVNRNGESALTHPAYVPYYNFLCPDREAVYHLLQDIYLPIAKVKEVDGIHLDYIRFPDVILARGLWQKYDLVMDKEYPRFDYCYCDSCTSKFKRKTGIDIKNVEVPSSVKEWKQFRYDLITKMVNRLAAAVHKEEKEISAAVFPGPNSVAKKLVRQEWNKWHLDAVYPMNYNDFYLKGTDWIGDVTREGIHALNGKTKLYSGLFILPNLPEEEKSEDPEGQGLTPEQLKKAIKNSMDNGATGICLFNPRRMTNKHWEVLKETINHQNSR